MHLDISKDSIFVINAWNQTMMTINDEGKVLKKYKYSQSDFFNEEGPFAIKISKDNRPFIGKVYVNCEYRPDQKPEISIRFAPKSYSEFCWGLPSLNVLSYYVEPRDEFVVPIPMFIQYLDKMERLRNSIWDQSILKTLNPTPTI